MKISLAMIVKNEEKHIRNCLESVKNIVDEIVIADTGSIDNTIKIAEEFNAHIYDFEWCDDFAAARNFAAEKCTGDWILVLDADECVSLGDRKTLDDFIKMNNKSIGRIEQHNKYLEGNEVAYSSEYISRFYPREIKFTGLVHEQLDSDLQRIKMNFRVEHSGYFNTDKSSRNLPLLLKMLKDDKEDTYILYQIARTLYVDKKYIEAQEYFKRAYDLMKKEFSYRKSLVIYYIHSIVNSNMNYETGLELINVEKDNYINDADFNFVCGIFYLNLISYNEHKYIKYISFIEESYLRCLEIGEKDSTVDGVGSFRAEYNLGVYYEVTGNIQDALNYYQKSAKKMFKPALNRLKELQNINIT